MARQSFSFFATVHDVMGSMRMSSSSDAPTPAMLQAAGYQNSPYQQHVCVASIFNRSGSNRIIHLDAIELDDQAAYEASGLGLCAHEKLERITNFTGGVPVISTPLDSSATALPSQVEAAIYPELVGASSLMRRMGATASAGPSFSPISSSGGFLRRLSSVDVIGHCESETQPVVLREGEGISLSISTPIATLLYSQVQPTTYTIWITVGSNTHVYSFVAHPTQTIAAFALMNRTGSGVLVSIQRVTSSRANGYGSYTPVYLLQTICDVAKGTVIPSFAHDSADTLPSGIEVLKNSVALMGMPDNLFCTSGGGRKNYEFGQAIIGKRPAIFRGVMGNGNFINSIGDDRAMYRRVPKNKRFDTAIQPLTLREGEGIAMFVRYEGGGNTLTALPRANINIQLSLEDTRYWSVTETFKNSSATNLPDGTPVTAFKVSDDSIVGSGTITSGVATILVNTASDVYLVVDPSAAGLGGETVCTLPITPT